MKRLLNSAFVVVALLIAATAALRSHSSATSFSATVRPDAPNAAALEAAATMARKPVLEIRKPVRYEAIITNWKRYRSTAKSSG
jgi:hypothetical protein